ncbi:hypothetical protein RhiirB3_455831 [Rhizophagus irregularis]|nr:hypothetical protein RhiirB3_455831 [Rhizophagus irregularis]
MSDNFNYDTFVRNPPNPVDTYTFSEHESLLTTPNSSPISNSFNISSFNVNGIVDTHLSPKQIHYLSKRLPNYTVFSSDIDKTKQVKSTGGVSLFIEKSLASHVQDFISHSSRILSVDLYFKGNVKLRTFHRDDQVTRIDYVWSCPLLKSFTLTSYIFDAQDICSSDHNPIITYFDDSLLFASIKVARTKQLQRRTRRIFIFDSVTDQQWESFSTHTDSLCDVPPSTFSTWYINQQCEYLHSRIVKAANASLPSVTVGNQHTPMMPKDLEALTQHYRFLSRLLHSVRLLRKYPSTYYNRYERTWDNNFETDISSFIDSALSRTRCRITLDRIFIDHLTHPKLLTDPHDIDDAVINHFQNSVPINSSPPDYISALPERWSSAYRPMDDVDSSIYNSLLDPPTLEEWLSTVSSMPNDKAPGPSMITYEMLKHLGSNTSALVLILVQSCFYTADIPDSLQKP